MNLEKYRELKNEISDKGARLVAVSKTKPVGDVKALYDAGQRLFGENKVQEMTEKHEALPKDIEWHLIGHLQTNKVKYIAPFVSLIHSVDSMKLLSEINRQAEKNGRIIHCLLQVSISEEETKYGLSVEDLYHLLESQEYREMKNILICGCMGMATNTIDENKVEQEFAFLQNLFTHVQKKYFQNAPHFKELSMGMTSDYKLALKHGATLIRVGSLIFGKRKY